MYSEYREEGTTVAANPDENPNALIPPTAITPYIGKGGPKLERLAAIPTDESFGGEDYQDAADLAQLAQMLIDRHEQFSFLKGERIEYLWKRKGGMLGGRVTWGMCQKTPPMARYYSANDFTIWCAADNCRIAKLTTVQLEALVYHELKHLAPKGDTGDAKIVGHDFEGFQDEVAVYGFWKNDIEMMAAVMVATAQQQAFDFSASYQPPLAPDPNEPTDDDDQ